MIVVCQNCQRQKINKGESTSQITDETEVSHGICPRCLFYSYALDKNGNLDSGFADDAYNNFIKQKKDGITWVGDNKSNYPPENEGKFAEFINPKILQENTELRKI